MQWQPGNTATGLSSMDTSPSEVLMLINQVINALGEAKEAVTTLQIEKRFNATMKATALMDSIEQEMKADISEGVRSAFTQTYLSLIANMTRTNVKNDLASAREALALMISFRQIWTTLYPSLEEECFAWPHSALQKHQRSGLHLA
ncbi:flagellar protein FliS [Kiloniella laminariae]|uniref:Flagellar protein FliS n=1 Tax=Kiloniella laminariae TaxID=454162 RepID=A0ABT4LHD8_9PROT|nr:flagellar protein FliS [Kiloniella laminariae]MCZ4280518.1 flagellar protein FliS [Kiloniella laminariae]